MFLAIVLWVIGWLFTMGVAWEDEFAGEDFLTILVDIVIAMVIWPFLLGQEFTMRFRRDGKVYKS